MDLIDAATAAGNEAADRVGLILEDVTVDGRGKNRVAIVTVDAHGDHTASVDIDLISSVARDISAALDERDVAGGPYTLEVSTPGIDRPLTLPRHFARARTRTVRVELLDHSIVRGVLRHNDDRTITVESDEGQTEVLMADIASARVEIAMGRA